MAKAIRRKQLTAANYLATPPELVIQEINSAVKALNRIFSPYEDVGSGLETQIDLKLSENRSGVAFTLNTKWSATMKEKVKNTIMQTAAKYPQIIVSY